MILFNLEIIIFKDFQIVFTVSSCMGNPVQGEVSTILYCEAGIVFLLFLIMVLYFPDSPPSPPSVTATVKRQNFMKGIRHILTKPKNVIAGKPFTDILSGKTTNDSDITMYTCIYRVE